MLPRRVDVGGVGVQAMHHVLRPELERRGQLPVTTPQMHHEATLHPGLLQYLLRLSPNRDRGGYGHQTCDGNR